MKQYNIKTLLKSMRVPFLILTPACVFLGYSVSITTTDKIQYLDFFLLLFGALFAHISVNTFNEYYDFRSGLDIKTTKTPFSGGSGALVENPEAANTVFFVALIPITLQVAGVSV